MDDMPIIQMIGGWGVLLLGLWTAIQRSKTLLPKADRINHIVLGFALALSFFGLCTLGLTAFHGLSYISLFGAFSIGIALTLFSCRKDKPRRWLAEVFAVLGILLGMGMFTLNSAENLWGRWDPGIYNNRAFALMHEGSFSLPDQSLAVLGEEWMNYYEPYRSSHKYVGVSRHPDAPEILTPSFFPLFPTMAAGLGLLLGPTAIFFVPGLFIGFSALFIFGFMREWMGLKVALASLLAFVLNPVVLYFSSFPTGEVASLGFLLATLFLWRCTKGGHAGVLAVSVLLLSLSSVSGLLLALMLSLLIVITLCPRSSWKFVLMVLPLLLLGQWAQHSLWSPRYAEQLSRYLPHVFSLLPVLVLIGILSLPLVYGLRRWHETTRTRIWNPWVLVLLLALALVWEGLGMKELTSWTRLSGMFSNWGCVALCVGAGLWISRKGAPAFYLLGITLAYTLLFLWSPMMSDNFPWAYKRFLALTVPLACCALGVLGAEALSAQKASRGLLLVLYVVSLALPLVHGRQWAFAREWQGSYDLLCQVDRAFPEEAILFAPTQYAEPMEFTFGRNVLPIYRFAEEGSLPEHILKTAGELKAHGHEVYFLWPRRLRALAPPEIQQAGKFRPAIAPYKLMQAPVPYRNLDRRKKLVVDLRLDEYLGVQKKRLE